MRTLLSILLALPVLAPSSRANEYEERTRTLLAELGVPDASSSTFEFGETLDKAFVRADLGLYQLYGPNLDFGRNDAAKNYRKVAGELLRLQGHFLGWLDPEEQSFEEQRSDLSLVGRWVDSWSDRDLLAAAQDGGGNLLDVLEADEGTREAVQRLASSMGRGEPLGLERSDSEPEVIVLVNDRMRYMRFLAFAGWVRPGLQGIFWSPTTSSWTNFFLDGRNYYASKYHGGDENPDGISMETRAKDALEQQIVQLATNALLDNWYGAKISPTLANGLSVNLVVDLYGECNTRVDGDLRERRTEAVEIFIPGVLDDGYLPKQLADSRWRIKHQGGNRFVDELKRSQKEAAKELRERTSFSFMLEDDNGAREVTIRAPFMGPSEDGVQLPGEDFYGDFEEFSRAYRTCFFDWLRRHSMGKDEDAARESFGLLLRAFARGSSTEDVLGAFQEVYEAPLSSPELSEEALETRFLEWLPRGR